MFQHCSSVQRRGALRAPIRCRSVCSLAARDRADDVGVTWIRDGEATDAVVPSASRAKLVVVAVEMVHTRLRQHRVVLNLTLPERRAVVRDEDELRLALAQRLQGGLVPQAVLPALHHQMQAGVDRVRGLGRLRGLLGSRHFARGKEKGRSGQEESKEYNQPPWL